MTTIEFVMLLGQQRYSHDFFRKAETEVRKALPGFRLHVFEEYDVDRRPEEVEAAIARCSCLFTSLIILGETSEWLVPVVERYDPPVVFCFESLPEVMRLTKVGSYGFKGGKGMPKPVQNVARLLVGGREEDTLYGYVKLQQITSKLIKFMPGKKMGDFRNWSTVQTYWSNRDVANAANMFKLIAQEYLGQTKLHIAAPREMPAMGFAHPDAPKLFAKPEEFERWEWERRAQSAERRAQSTEHRAQSTERESGRAGERRAQSAERRAGERESGRAQSAERRAGERESGRAGERESAERRAQSGRAEDGARPIGTVAVLSFRAHILTGTQYHNEVVRALEAQGLRVIPIFCMGIETHIAVREWLPKMGVDLVVNTMGFPLVGGPAGSTKAGLTATLARELLEKLDVPYIVAQPLFVQDKAHWREHGVGPLQSTMLYSLPEMDGAVAPVVLGGMQGNEITIVPDRVERLATLARRFVALRKTENRRKKVAIVVYNYPPGQGKTATAALLDVPRSLSRLLGELEAAGYDVGRYPRDPATFVHCLAGTLGGEVRSQKSEVRSQKSEVRSGNDSAERGDTVADHPAVIETTANRAQYYAWLSPAEQGRIEARWGSFPGDIAPLGRDEVRLGGMQLGNVYIGVQPMIGMPGDPMRLLFDKENTPHHQYALFYKYIVEDFGADAIVHLGMHGTAEWMPGVQLGPTAECWPDVLLGAVPNFYVYPINNPAEANIAKRRGYSTIIGHAIPPYGRAGLYRELQGLRELLEESGVRIQESEFRRTENGELRTENSEPRTQNREPRTENPELRTQNREPRTENPELRTQNRNHLVEAQRAASNAATSSTDEEAILHKIALLNLDSDLARHHDEPFVAFAGRVYAYLRELEQTLIIDSLHELGTAAPAEQQLSLIVEALKIGRDGKPGLAEVIADCRLQIADYASVITLARAGDARAQQQREQVEALCSEFVQQAIIEGRAIEQGDPQGQDHFATFQAQGQQLLVALRDNTQEIGYLLKGLEGGYIPAAPGGDLIRDGLAVLPTGRNIHSLDPFRIPTESAYRRGLRIAEALITAHRSESSGAYPETIAQVLWGLDTIKTKGESIAVVLGLIGARALYDGQGKITRYALIPLEELGRPRIDVLMTASGVFRDTFASTMDLLDRLVREAAQAVEPPEQNFIRKHVEDLLATGQSFEAATARIFTQAEGTYGTDVDEAIEGSAWQERVELEALFVKRNAYAFGGKQNGVARPEALRSLLGTVGRVAQEIDSVEYGLTDMQHYYGYSGALKAAAERASGKKVALNFVESFTAETKIQSLDQVLRVEYRTKLLNPKWYEGMLKHGHNGVAEIAQRFTYMLGWSATTDAVDNWVYEQAAQTFVLDDAMRERLEAANPEATRNAIGRLLEANSRGIWQTDEETLDRLRELHGDLEDRLEGVL